MNVDVEVLSEVTSEVVEAFGRLIPQLSSSAKPLDAAALSAIVATPASTVLIARVDGDLVGTLTLVTFPIPTGVRAWIEDVVTEESARGKGVATALIDEAIRLAKQASARTIDLSSRPARAAAGVLYERMGFEQRETRMYRYKLT
ncbi:MAG TPA: GNAT family N-acetyltransferase [Streptosporangiaceae bacterium]|nr:GNAT family N-acetyltransferase [Streptosporangiaceae bacterium]